MTTLKLLFISALLLLISACGGGGGGSSGPVASNETFQLKTAYVNFFNGSNSLPFTLSGTTSGYTVTGSGTLTESAPVNGTFESVSALQKNSAITYTFTANNVTSSTASSSSSYADSNYVPLGGTGSEYSVITGNASIPLTARVGDSGTWSTQNRYTNSSKSTLVGTTTTTYVLEPDTASTALLKIIDTDKNTSGTTTGTTIETYRITPSGGITHISVSISESPTYLVFTF
jgi:hypothetical protein